MELLLTLAFGGAVGLLWHKKMRRTRASVPDWMRRFIVFYAANEVYISGGTGHAYREIRALIESKPTFSLEQSLLVWLKPYVLATASPHGDMKKDFPEIIRLIPKVLKYELAAYNRPAAITAMLNEENPEWSEKSFAEQNEIAQGIYKAISSGDPEVMGFEDMLIRRRLEQSFKRLHGKEFSTFSDEVLRLMARE